MKAAAYLLIAVLAVHLPTASAAEGLVKRLPTQMVALQVNKKQTFDLINVGAYYNIPNFPGQFPDWAVVGNANVEVARISATKLTIKIKKKGFHSFLFQPKGQKGFALPIPVAGYELDTRGAYAPQVIDQDPLSWDASAPVQMIGSLRMSPFIEGVRYNVNFFAHKTTFINGARSFSITTGDEKTSLGEAGWTVETAADGSTTGVLRFKMTMPGNEKSWCLKTSQSQAWPDLTKPPTGKN